MYIGEFSKICGVSIKTLYHYDEISLIKPFNINCETGYRYYHVDQLPTMLLINRLKAYGFTLDKIKEIINCESQSMIMENLMNQKDILKNEILEKDKLLIKLDEHIEKFERTNDIMSYQNKYEIKLIKRDSIAILSSRKVMGIMDFGIENDKLLALATKKGISDFKDYIAIYHDVEFNPNKSDIEVAVVIDDESRSTRILKGGLCATTIHYGGYENLPDAYASIVTWIEKNQYEIIDSPYEVYLKMNENIDENETLICFPVQKKEDKIIKI